MKGTFLYCPQMLSTFKTFPSISAQHMPPPASSSSCLFPWQLASYEVWSTYATSTWTHPNLASNTTDLHVVKSKSCFRNFSYQFYLHIVLKILLSLGFYETFLPWLYPTCPPIRSLCSSLNDLKCKLYPCSNLPVASKIPANLSSLKILPLSSVLTALLSHLVSFHFQSSGTWHTSFPWSGILFSPLPQHFT